MFPGYVLIHMVMNDDTWYVVRNTRGGFVGPGSKPVPLTPAEMKPLGISVGVQNEETPKKEKIDIDVEVGEISIVVTSGAWEGTTSAVTVVNEHKQTVTIEVEMFGRATSSRN